MQGSAVDALMASIEQVIAKPNYSPRWGWHNDHRELDGTSEYLPALMQVREEYREFVEVLHRHHLPGLSCLQLGMGPCTASHDAWARLFYHATTIDLERCAWSNGGWNWGGYTPHAPVIYPGRDSHCDQAIQFAARFKPYHMLFIDAGHSYEDVKWDYELYEQFVEKDGIIAFHDALPRSEYPEVGVPRFLDELRRTKQVAMIGSEVGIAWIRKS